jgi:hypothetical protein
VKHVIKIILYIYILLSLFCFLTLVIVNFSNRPEVIKQYGSPAFYSEKELFLNGDSNAYKELNSIITDLWGFSTVQASISTKGEVKLYNNTYSIKFLGNDVISSLTLTNNNYDSMIEKDIFKVNQRSFPRYEFIKIAYEDENFICTTSLNLHTVTCRTIVR